VHRREFLKSIAKGALASAAVGGVSPAFAESTFFDGAKETFYEDLASTPAQVRESITHLKTLAPDRLAYLAELQHREEPVPELSLNQYLAKMQDFEASHREDIFVPTAQFDTLVATFKRLDRVQSLVGHGNFNVLSFDDALNYSRRHSAIGAFEKSETKFIESIFATNALDYGFFGNKIVDDLTSVVKIRDRKKVGSTGHYLFRGDAENLFRKLQSDLAGKVVLTSGIRNIVKQTHLFLAKAIQSEGNLSRASRSLAPPGHSFHGIGDFDVGKIGFGSMNFTEQFAKTAEFGKLVKLGYIDMRYPEDNLLGVRYEPWHIKVV
jgi:hypothetical protein